MSDLGIYIHIPFCIKKCRYCDFYSISSDKYLRSKYIDTVITQLQRLRNNSKKHKINSVYIGGGTPSILSIELLDKLFTEMHMFDLSKDCEITMEVNPGTVDFEKIRAIKSFGVNRISIGAQSMCDDELKFLGRIHSTKDVIQAYNMFLIEGLKNINIDMLFAVPTQSFDTFEATLKRIVSLEPKHISAYPLKIEDNTEFGEMRRNGMIGDFDDGLDRDMYHYLIDFLAETKYIHYEISNFSKSGYRSRHNLKYWDLSDYIGIGVTAHSFYGNERYRNHNDIYKYISESDKKFDVEKYDEKDLMKDYMMLGLRRIDGVDPKAFLDKFSVDIHEEFSEEIKELIDQKLIVEEDTIKLTGVGLDYANSVFRKFV